MSSEFRVEEFRASRNPKTQYERQLQRLIRSRIDVQPIEKAVRGAIENIRTNSRSFVIYGEPQSGKTEMMICLTAKLIDEGHQTIIHLLNDSVDLLGQNLGRFKGSGLAPAARNFSEVLDPAVKIRGQPHVIFCKKNGSDLRKLIEKLNGISKVVVIDDEADYASPNSKVNKGQKTPINDLISQILGRTGTYIGVTATPARLDLNNTFDNDSSAWVDFPPHDQYTGQDVFFPVEGELKYLRSLLPDAGADPKYSRQALFSFLANVAYLNNYVNESEQCYSFLIHTSGKKADHKSDWGTVHAALGVLISRQGEEFSKYAKAIWQCIRTRYPDADADSLTHYVLDNISRYALVVLNSERDWKDNSGAATDPKSLFTIIIGGNIVSRGVTLKNLLSMFFTRDVKHKIQQDTYIQRARMFGNRGKYLGFFELTIPQTLYVDWHRCFVFHRLALSAIKEGFGSLVWIGDNRIAPAAAASVDRSTVDLDRGEMAFGRFPFSSSIADILRSADSSAEKIDQLAREVGEAVFPSYLRKFIERTSIGNPAAAHVHGPLSVANYKDADLEKIERKKGFIGASQIGSAPSSAVHHVFVAHNGRGTARIIYKFKGTIQFIKNTVHDR